MRHQAQWDIATSFLTQARVVAASSPTLARGQFVRATTELLRVSELFHDHPQIGTIPDILWGVSDELAARNYHDEAISVWNEIQIHYPTHKLADQSALRIAQTWQRAGQPLRAAEAFLELNYARGGSDADLQNTIYQIAVTLKNEKRWIESLHVLQTFVDSFPAHANAGQSLTMIGQIHQTNEVWDDAMDAYRRVIDEFPTGTWTTEACWSIAECTINLSLWQEAMGAYASFQESYPKDARVAEAARRIEVLKVLDRYQGVVDEAGQRKAFDAQFQVAAIVRMQLTNPVKAIIEYRKVAKNWPQSHLADDALFEIGKIYLELGETELARTALLESAESYPNSPLADDALLLVGTSYVSEADRLAAVDRGKSQEIAKDIAQKEAYRFAQDNTRRQLMRNSDCSEKTGETRRSRQQRGLLRGAGGSVRCGEYTECFTTGHAAGRGALGRSTCRPTGQDQCGVEEGGCELPAGGERSGCGHGRRRVTSDGSDLRPAVEGFGSGDVDLGRDRQTVQRHGRRRRRQLEHGELPGRSRRTRQGHRRLPDVLPHLSPQ